MTVRWPWQPLSQHLGGSARTQAARLGVDDRQVYRWRSEGLSDRLTDRCAIRAGLHPAIVWPDWGDRDERVPEPVDVATEQASRRRPGRRTIVCDHCKLRKDVDRRRLGFVCDECAALAASSAESEAPTLR